ncbi:gatA1, partial [Symbiodinium pilosum]
ASESTTGILPLELKPETLLWTMHTFLGQIAQFVFEYLDAPVSLKEIADDTTACEEHIPNRFYNLGDPPCKSETDYRYAMGPHIE